MKKKLLIIILILILIIPIPFHLKDGGTIEFKALLYQVSKVHKLNSNSPSGYDNGIIIKIFGIKVFDNVGENTMNNNDNKNSIIESNYKDINFDLTKRQVTLNNGDIMPLNGLGTYSLTGDTCYDAVSSALSTGVRLFDTAYMYGNEEEIGKAIRDSGIPREEIFVITKIYPSQFNDPESAIELALKKLDIDYIDMMLLHHPGTNDVEAYKAMEKYVGMGKIHSLGLSNWYVKELKEFLPQINIAPALVQNEIHPYYQENDVIPFIQNLDIVVQGWYPFGGRGHTSELLNNETITKIADNYHVSGAQVILRWNLQKGVVVIPGSSNPTHIKENTDIYGFELTPDEMQEINNLDRNEKHDWY